MSDLQSLSPAKRALLEQALRRRRARAGAAEAIPRRDPDRPVPLSSTQRRMWFFQQWETDSPTFNAARAIRLRGELDRDALLRALRAVVGRHEALRTVVAPGPEPSQVVLDAWALELPVTDLTAAFAADPEALHRRLRELAREPFDLTADLMMRTDLIDLGPGDRVLLLRLHHIVGDAHSDTILFTDLAEFYDAYRTGREPVLAEIQATYADYTLWQNERLAGSLQDELISFWVGELDGAPPLLAMPTDKPRPAVQRHTGMHRRFALHRELGEGLIEIARPTGATFFMAALAAFGTVIYRRSGADDIVFGSPFANRNHAQLDHTFGFFSNTVALRLRLGGNPSFRELLTRARDLSLGALAHQELPFERLVEAVAPKRDPSYHPIFQVNFRAQVADRAVLQLSGLDTESIPVDIGFARFDFALELELRRDALTGYFELNDDLFVPATADGWAEDLALVLEQVTADPEVPILTVKLPTRSTGGAGARIARRRRS